jgi:chemotaxis signal transduction protein
VIDSEDLIAHMRRVQVAERDLRDLGVVWQMIEASAAISCPEEVATILPTLVNTRQRFDGLQGRLIEQMVAAHCMQVKGELAARAQCAIDILVRNLYERTADVGFLATDDEVRAFCGAEPARRDGLREAMVRRLAEYQAKYTVYDDVLLLSPQGEVLARLDEGQALPASRDALVPAALSAAGYVERFGPSDLAATPAPALLYGHRITGADGRAIGVLVLRFRFADEMRRIFGAMAAGRDELALMLLDADQQVIASHDEAHVPLGARLPRSPGGEVALLSFAGRAYLAVCCAGQGYQGYAGPPWRALAMVSLLTAFRRHDGEAGGPAAAVPLDSAELAAVHADADAIHRDLRRVVWNGRLMAGQHGGERSRLNAVLRQVQQAGVRTRSRVSQAIRDLSRAALARSCQQAHELARLAADIMDRNLYERANDCRWWALSPVLRRVLDQPPATADWAALNAVLKHVNGLYTVYSRLVVFDAAGRVRAASGDPGEVVGRSVPPAWTQAVQGLADSQRYAVSAFEPTELHAHGATYVYLAAVRDLQDERRIVGGIAVVFHAARELAAMLGDVLGTHAGGAAFIGADGQVLAATDAALAAALAPALHGDGGVLEARGAHHACARVRAGGYREFKAGDGYDNQVHALVALRLGTAGPRHADSGDPDLAALPVEGGGTTLEAALFQVGAARYALPAGAVIEAVSAHGLVPTPGAGGGAIGMIEVPAGPAGATAMVRVLCARQLFRVDDGVPRAAEGVVLVLRAPQQPQRPALGLRVDDVLAVLDVSTRHLHQAPQQMSQFAPWVAGLLECELSTAGKAPGQGERVLAQLLALDPLVADLGQPVGVA